MINEKFIMAGPCALRVRDSGPDAVAAEPTEAMGSQKTGLPIVLLHGYLESLEVWEELQKELLRHHRVISLDLPGHGIAETKGENHTMEFMADTVHAALEVLGVGRAVIIGHSMGGYVALEYLRKYREEVAGLVLFHSTPNPDSEEKKLAREREVGLIQAGKKELIARMFPQVGFAPQNRERLAERITDLSDQITLTEDDGIIAALRGMASREDRNDTLRTSGVPQLFIFGRHDEYTTPEAAEQTIEAHPQAEVQWLENSGHMGFIEEPEKSLKIITDFLGRITT